jgi:hypothetical protein
MMVDLKVVISGAAGGGRADRRGGACESHCRARLCRIRLAGIRIQNPGRPEQLFHPDQPWKRGKGSLPAFCSEARRANPLPTGSGKKSLIVPLGSRSRFLREKWPAFCPVCEKATPPKHQGLPVLPTVRESRRQGLGAWHRFRGKQEHARPWEKTGA